MTSWHENLCRRPDIFLVEGIASNDNNVDQRHESIPVCLACGTGAFEDGIVKPPPTSAREIPPSPPPWDLNLTWPESVHYLTETTLYLEGKKVDLVQAVKDLHQSSQGLHDDQTGREGEVAAQTSEKENEPPSISIYPPSPMLSDGLPSPFLTSHYQQRTYPRLGIHHQASIRLFRLGKGKKHEPLRGTLFTATLDSDPYFTALSYTWSDEKGDSSRCRPLYLGEWWDVVWITRNCEAALRRLRKMREEVVLWVDSICIDQEYQRERNHQVGLMQRIYSSAAEVAVFLGEGVPQSRHGMRKLLELKDEDTCQVERAGIVETFSLPYFSRVWVLQEVAHARQATLYCGENEVLWSLISEDRLKNLGIVDEVPPWVYRLHQNPFHSVSELAWLLKATAPCKASDPRDKIFALFSLIKDAEKEGLTPDYSLASGQVSMGMAAYLLQQSPRRIGFGGGDQANDLVSWTWDWQQWDVDSVGCQEQWESGWDSSPFNSDSYDLLRPTTLLDLASLLPSPECIAHDSQHLAAITRNRYLIHRHTGALIVEAIELVRMENSFVLSEYLLGAFRSPDWLWGVANIGVNGRISLLACAPMAFILQQLSTGIYKVRGLCSYDTVMDVEQGNANYLGDKILSCLCQGNWKEVTAELLEHLIAVDTPVASDKRHGARVTWRNLCPGGSNEGQSPFLETWMRRMFRIEEDLDDFSMQDWSFTGEMGPPEDVVEAIRFMCGLVPSQGAGTANLWDSLRKSSLRPPSAHSRLATWLQHYENRSVLEYWWQLGVLYSTYHVKPRRERKWIAIL